MAERGHEIFETSRLVQGQLGENVEAQETAIARLMSQFMISKD